MTAVFFAVVVALLLSAFSSFYLLLELALVMLTSWLGWLGLARLHMLANLATRRRCLADAANVLCLRQRERKLPVLGIQQIHNNIKIHNTRMTDALASSRAWLGRHLRHLEENGNRCGSLSLFSVCLSGTFRTLQFYKMMLSKLDSGFSPRSITIFLHFMEDIGNTNKLILFFFWFLFLF